ncbi:hypothetical protein MO973_33745 [Paenibacillus sp. TRM 82003]|nr:hypothetical protein [Paenibacillus sp. TRM 82003]
MDQTRKHSRIGIASFILAVVSIVGIIGSVVAASTMATSLAVDPAAVAPGELPEIDEGALGGLLAVAGLMFLFLLSALVGGVLGIVGLFQKERLKLFSILGLTFNALLVFAFLLIFLAATLLGDILPGAGLS